jgi:hypothetical protein
MQLPPENIDAIAALVEEATRAVVDASERCGARRLGETSPIILRQILGQLIETLRRIERDPRLDDTLLSRRWDMDPRPDVAELGEYGLAMLGELAEWAELLRLPQASHAIRDLVIALGVWVVRHDGEIQVLEPVVDALASAANSTMDTRTLSRLAGLMEEICAGVAHRIRSDLVKDNPGRPWRLLLINRGIVATRAHSLPAMEAAFGALIEYLPEDAPGFFRDGMAQIEALDHPAGVRAVIKKYYDAWALPLLH